MSITNYFKTRSIKLDDVSPNNTIPDEPVVDNDKDHSNDATNVSTSPLSPQPTIIEPFVNSYEDNSSEVANIAAISLSPTPTELECVIIDNGTNHSSLKCTGLLYEVDVFKNFPFAVLASQEFVIEYQNFHHQMCMENNYTICEVSQDDKNLNKCYDINFSTKYKKFFANSQNSEIYKTLAKNELLSFNQMAQRINTAHTCTNNFKLL